MELNQFVKGVGCFVTHVLCRKTTFVGTGVSLPCAMLGALLPNRMQFFGFAVASSGLHMVSWGMSGRYTIHYWTV